MFPINIEDIDESRFDLIAFIRSLTFSVERKTQEVIDLFRWRCC